jgi:hypothetical protein
LPPLPPALIAAMPGRLSEMVVMLPLLAGVTVAAMFGPLAPPPPADAFAPIVKQPPKMQISTPAPKLPLPPFAPRWTFEYWWRSPAAVGKVKPELVDPVDPLPCGGGAEPTPALTSVTMGVVTVPPPLLSSVTPVTRPEVSWTALTV